jgi:hypothetical protein
MKCDYETHYSPLCQPEAGAISSCRLGVGARKSDASGHGATLQAASFVGWFSVEQVPVRGAE